MRSRITLPVNIILVTLSFFACSAVMADPVLEQLAENNESLIEIQRDVAAHMSALKDEQLNAESVSLRIEADFQDTREILKTIGSIHASLGRPLLEHRASLPDRQILADKIQSRTDQMAEVGVRRILHREEARRGIQSKQAVEILVAELSEEPTLQLRNAVRELLSQRQSLLVKTVADDYMYLQRLQNVNDIERQLLSSVTEYNEFLDQYLWWVRATEPFRVQDLLTLPESLSTLVSQTLRSTNLTTDFRPLLFSKILWFSVFIGLMLQWKRRAIRRVIQQTAQNIGRVTLDRFACTIKALVLTVLAALPLPLVLVTAGWLLSDRMNQAHAVDLSLLRIALLLYVLNFFRWICIDKGLCDAHFKWPAAAVKRVRNNLDRLTWVFVPTALLTSLAYTQNPTDTGGIVFRIGFLAFQLALSIFLYRLLHAQHGVLKSWLKQHKSALLTRFYPAVFWVSVIIPSWLAIEALAGYGHTALVVSTMYLNTLGLIAFLALVYAMAHRWLLLVNRQLAYTAAIERRKTILAEREARSSGEATEERSELVLDEPEINLTELSDNTHSVVMIATVGLGLIGLFIIWSPSFAAFRYFDTFDLWYHEVTVDGETRRLPTTVADIGLAVIYLFGTAILVFRLPSVMEILLLQRSSMSESDRYTVNKLFTYTLTAIGVLLALNAIGATWSQMQWLVAALGVGIGFGLQEIVANFISGLIILFERPDSHWRRCDHW